VRTRNGQGVVTDTGSGRTSGHGHAQQAGRASRNPCKWFKLKNDALHIDYLLPKILQSLVTDLSAVVRHRINHVQAILSIERRMPA